VGEFRADLGELGLEEGGPLAEQTPRQCVAGGPILVLRGPERADQAQAQAVQLLDPQMIFRRWRRRGQIHEGAGPGQDARVDGVRLGQHRIRLGEVARPVGVEGYGRVPGSVERPPEREVEPPRRLEHHPAGAARAALRQAGEKGRQTRLRVREAARQPTAPRQQHMQIQRGFTYIDAGVN
jgi:hypothetical protein